MTPFQALAFSYGVCHNSAETMHQDNINRQERQSHETPEQFSARGGKVSVLDPVEPPKGFDFPVFQKGKPMKPLDDGCLRVPIHGGAQ